MDIGNIIVAWYNKNKRDLPWRNSKEPYIIWVSEIIMQQTRINQGLPYFLKFIKNFPTVFDLANASEDAILLTWQGLGYYSRARNMHFTAKQIANEYDGQFPKTAKELKKLKGIGEYTSAAISSFCFNENIPAIDGNVTRVIARLFGIKEPVDKLSTIKLIKELSLQLVHTTDAADYNQGMMDLGATICTPQNPDCFNCPIQSKCIGIINDLQSIIPLKTSKTKITTRYFYYLVFVANTSTLVLKRNNNDIWKGLFEFPLIEKKTKITIEDLLISKEFTNTTKYLEINNIKTIETPVHKLSHQSIFAHFVIINTNLLPKINNAITIQTNNIDSVALPQLIIKTLPKIFV